MSVATISTDPDVRDPDFNWDQYTPRSMGEVFDYILPLLEDEFPLSFAEDQQYYIEGGWYPFCTLFVYTGETRPIPDLHLNLILTWTHYKSPETDPEFIRSVLHAEGRFEENGQTYWFPLQDTIIDAMANEVQTGGQVVLFLLWVGALPQDDHYDIVFMTNAYLPYP